MEKIEHKGHGLEATWNRLWVEQIPVGSEQYTISGPIIFILLAQ
jgi:hypothetical protein